MIKLNTNLLLNDKIKNIYYKAKKTKWLIQKPKGFVTIKFKHVDMREACKSRLFFFFYKVWLIDRLFI